MAIDGEIKFKGSKALKYNLVDNTWYPLNDLKPLWWFKFDDNYTFSNNNTVPLNEHVFSNAGTEIVNLKTVIKNRVLLPTCSITISVPDIVCTAHGLTLGEMITPTTTAGGFTANSIYYVILVTDPNSFRVSTTYTTTNNPVTPTATVASSTWFKRQGLTMNAGVATEGYRSMQFDGTNHMTGDYLIGSIPTNKTFTKWSFYLCGRVNSSGQPFPAGITPNMYLMELRDSTNYITVERTPTNQLSLTYNGNNLIINIANAFTTNSSLAWYILVTYDGSTLTFKFSQSIFSEYTETVSLSNVSLILNSATTVWTMGAKNDGTNCMSKLFYDTFRFYDRCLTDQEFNILYNGSDMNNFSSIYPIYRYFDFYRWQCDEKTSATPMQQIGYTGRITPNNGTVNLLRMNDNTGVIVGQIEDGITCYKFDEANKGYLSSTIDMGATPTTDGLTLCMWFKDTSSSVLRRRWITNSTLAAGKGTSIFSVGQDSSASNTIRLTVDNVETFISTTDWRNVWNFWCLVFDSIKNITYLYKNGILIGSVADAVLNPSAGFYIGGKNTTTDNEYINGFVRDIIYKPYKMNIGEMKLIYNNGKPLNI